MYIKFAGICDYHCNFYHDLNTVSLDQEFKGQTEEEGNAIIIPALATIIPKKYSYSLFTISHNT